MSRILQRFEPLLNPASIAFIGASRNPVKWGHRVLAALLKGGYEGRVYPVNPRETEILGLPVFPTVSRVPQPVDLAVIVVSPAEVPQVISDCVARGIKAGVIITAGFAEAGNDGKLLEKEIVARARAGGMILVGPNCNGIISTHGRLYPTMGAIFPPSGPLAVVSQSGNVGASLVRQAQAYGIGISHYINTGNEADLHNEDFIEFLGEDPRTKVVLAYVEGIKDGRRLLDVGRRVARKKPLLLLKGGTTGAGAGAARSHSASMATPETISTAAFRQAGIIEVADLFELFYSGAAFLYQPLPSGRRVGIVAAGGGWGVLASDACARAGLEVVSLPRETMEDFDRLLPPWWSHGNPVDLVGGYGEQSLEKSIETLLRCPVVDQVLVLVGGVSRWRLESPPRANTALQQEDHGSGQRDAAKAQKPSFAGTLDGLVKTYGKPVALFVEAEHQHEDKQGATMELEKMGLIPCPLPHYGAAVLANLARYVETQKCRVI